MASRKRSASVSGGVAKRVKASFTRQAAAASRTSGYQKGLQRAYTKEKGYVDTAPASYPLNTTGSVTLLNTVAQGAAVTQRVGKKIVLKGLQCRGIMYPDAGGVLNDVAYMIVYDKRPTGALPTITDILVTASAQSMNNDANAGRFRILKRVDDVLIGNPSLTGVVANALTEATMKSADWWLDLKSAEVVYKAAGTGAIGDIEQGALYLVTIGGTVAGTTDANLDVSFRLRFLDI